MIILNNNNNEKKKKCVSHEDLQYLGIQLRDFIKTYREKIYIDDPRYFNILNYLEKINDKILMCKYDELFNDPSVVSFEIPDEISYDEFLQEREIPF